MMSSNGSNPEMDTNVTHISKAYCLEMLSFFICIQTNLHSECDEAFWIRICLKDFNAVRAYFLRLCRIFHALESSPYMQVWFVIQLNWVWPVVYLSCVHFWKPVLSGLYFVMNTFLKLGVIRLSLQCNWCLYSGMLCLVSGQWMCKVLNLHYGPIYRSQISNETSGVSYPVLLCSIPEEQRSHFWSFLEEVLILP